MVAKFKRPVFRLGGVQAELLARFDSEGVRAAVQRKFLTEAQPAGMRAGAFVLQKYQLFKRLNPAEDGKGALPNIIDLLHDKIRPLVKVAQPSTFEELREIVRQLEEEHKSKTEVFQVGHRKPITQDDVYIRRCFQCGKTGHVKSKCPMSEN